MTQERGARQACACRAGAPDAAAAACRYHRSWGENHFGDGWVQKYGHSTAGEQWDVTDQSGTYYNPMPHFNFQMALDHSPDLLHIPVKPREATLEEFMDGGMDDF